MFCDDKEPLRSLGRARDRVGQVECDLVGYFLPLQLRFRERGKYISRYIEDGSKEIDKPVKLGGGQPVCIRFQKLSFRPKPVAKYTGDTVQEPDLN